MYTYYGYLKLLYARYVFIVQFIIQIWHIFAKAKLQN